MPADQFALSSDLINELLRGMRLRGVEYRRIQTSPTFGLGFAAGELKHGPIALIEEGQPVIVVVPSPSGEDSLHPKVVSNIQEIKARGARVIAVAEEGDSEVAKFADQVFYVPETHPFMAAQLSVVPLQIFAAELASAKGLDVDQPRNLAKSVTVE